MMLDLQMKFISLLFFSWGVQNCLGGWCFHISRLVGKSRGSTSEAGAVDLARTSDPSEVDEEAEIALAKASSYKMRPLVMPNWEDNEEMISAMVNEAEYNFEQANKLSQSQMYIQDLRFIEEFDFYNRKILTLARQKAFRLKSSLDPEKTKKPDGSSDRLKSVENLKEETRLGSSRSHHLPPVEDPSALKALNPTDGNKEKGIMLPFDRSRSRRPQGPVFESQSSRYFLFEEGSELNLEMIDLGLDLEAATFQIIEELKGCLLFIFPRCKPLDKASVKQHEDFIKAVFRGVEFLHKYNFINQDDMKNFFTSDTYILSLTGQHIGSTIPLIFHSVETTQQLDRSMMVLSPETDHIRHCLKDLDDTSLKLMIHIAFSNIFERSKSFIHWPSIPSKLEASLLHLTGEALLADVLERKQNEDAMIERSILEAYVAPLIKFFEQPRRFLKEFEENHSSDTYILSANFLYHISQNLCNEHDLKYICDQSEVSYDQFKAKIEIFVIVHRIICLKGRWDFYDNNKRADLVKVFPKIQTNLEKISIEQNINQLIVEYYEILQEMDSNENCRKWKQFQITRQIINEYSALLQSTLKDLKEAEENTEASNVIR